MLKKGLKEKSVKVVLVCSLAGIGTSFYMPAAYAEEGTAVIQEDARTVNSLSKLEIKDIALDQKFAEDVLDYSATVANEVEKITLLAESINENATISVNGVKLTNGKAKDLALQTGINTFKITVSDGINETMTYTVKVEKLESDDNFLTSIGLSSGSLPFDSKVTAYNVSVENEIKTITLSPTLSDSAANVKVNGTAATSGGVKVPLRIGKTMVKIIVTAENGDEKTYTLTITRAAAKKTESKDKDAESKEDTVQKEPITGANKTQPSASKGDKPSSTPVDSFNNVKTSNGSKVSKVQQNENISTQKTKSIPVEEAVSADSLGEEGKTPPFLNNLTVSTGVWNKPFDSNEHTYHVKVDNDITSVEMNAASSASGATVEYEGESSRNVKIKDKAKTAISVTVSKDGNRRTYVIVFEKDMDVEMDEEETVDDIKTNETEVEATQMSTAGKTETVPSNDKVVQGMLNGNEPAAAGSFWGKVKAFFTSLF
ncbi:cadherin-like beta sandwich domain-containing protein [Peribacillus sp. NPDC060253]|uniref:cadherin-like beta sandwich domain-containing protein n=1 Tax=Peribacillus sp. NPDC060253 TaxID=3347084 RepID=UPI00366A1A35